MTPADQISDAGTTRELSTSGAMNLRAQPCAEMQCLRLPLRKALCQYELHKCTARVATLYTLCVASLIFHGYRVPTHCAIT